MCNCTDVAQKEISGYVSLLLMWAWERFPILAPEIKDIPDPLRALNHPLSPLGRRKKWLRFNRKDWRPNLLGLKMLSNRLWVQNTLVGFVAWDLGLFLHVSLDHSLTGLVVQLIQVEVQAI